jgi:hypothetical protein
LEDLEKDHRVYAFLARVCTSFHVQECISRAICASSTDSYPGKELRILCHHVELSTGQVKDKAILRCLRH